MVYSIVLHVTCTVMGLNPTNGCGHMICKHVDQKDLAAILTSIKSAGVALQVNLQITTGEKAHKQEIHPGFETQGRHYQKSETGVSVASQRGLMSFKN